MDLNDYWQTNKRFVVSVASGALVFVIGSMLVDSFFRAELTKHERDANASASKLRSSAMYGTAELERAQAENQALAQAIARLSKAVEFQTRPRFQLDAAKGAASNQYFGTVGAVREELLRAAGRANLRLPEDLGLPALSPTKELEIQKTLEAFDLVERVVRLCIAQGIERVDRIEIKLDPKLASREGVGEIERTRVSFTLSGAPQPMVRLLVAAQGEAAGSAQPLSLERAEITPARGKADEATLEATFCVVRLHPRSTEETASAGK